MVPVAKGLVIILNNLGTDAAAIPQRCQQVGHPLLVHAVVVAAVVSKQKVIFLLDLHGRRLAAVEISQYRALFYRWSIAGCPTVHWGKVLGAESIWSTAPPALLVHQDGQKILSAIFISPFSHFWIVRLSRPRRSASSRCETPAASLAAVIASATRYRYADITSSLPSKRDSPPEKQQSGGAKCAAKIPGTGCVLCTPGYAIL